MITQVTWIVLNQSQTTVREGKGALESIHRFQYQVVQRGLCRCCRE